MSWAGLWGEAGEVLVSLTGLWREVVSFWGRGQVFEEKRVGFIYKCICSPCPSPVYYGNMKRPSMLFADRTINVLYVAQ